MVIRRADSHSRTAAHLASRVFLYFLSAYRIGRNETARQSKTHAARAKPNEMDWRYAAANSYPPWRTSRSKSARSSQTYALI
jgi:hypothetical protein